MGKNSIEGDTDPSSAPRNGERTRPELVWDAMIPGQMSTESSVRIARHRHSDHHARTVRFSPGSTEPREGLGFFLTQAKHFLIGTPIATAAAAHERLNKTRALAIFSADAISSVAYAAEEIMKVLILAGVGALSLTLPIAFTIALLLAIVATSYRQTISAYPSGGGSYIVASDNLGTVPGLVAAASLMIDYTLTVAVSVAAGVAAITSAFPALLPQDVLLAVVAVVLLTLGNLRGLRESGTIFAIPTYLFMFSLYGLIIYGGIRVLTGGIDYVAAVPPPNTTQDLGLFLILRAFSQGCTAMTGTEAISNGVPAFKDPAPQNARTTLGWMALILATLFIGMSFLAMYLHIIPNSDETVFSQIARAVTGTGPFYYLVQFSTALILFVAANTSFNGFPMLVSVLARDGYAPHQFSFRGDRLVYSNGILLLAGLAILLLLVFNGSIDALIGLYAIGVFASFTLSQSGMVVHWLRTKGANWRQSMTINTIGAICTAVVTVVIGVAKFHDGAWIVLVVTPIIVAVCLLIKGHYGLVAAQTRPETPLDPAQISLRVIVPVGKMNLPVRQALALAQAMSKTVIGVHVTDDAQEAEELQGQWEEHIDGNGELIIIESPYRSLVGPFLAYLDLVHEQYPYDTIMVILPEFVPSRIWEHLLHNKTAFLLKAALLFRPGIVVTNVPYHIRRSKYIPQVAKVS